MCLRLYYSDNKSPTSGRTTHSGSADQIPSTGGKLPQPLAPRGAAFIAGMIYRGAEGGEKEKEAQKKPNQTNKNHLTTCTVGVFYCCAIKRRSSCPGPAMRGGRAPPAPRTAGARQAPPALNRSRSPRSGHLLRSDVFS